MKATHLVEGCRDHGLAAPYGRCGEISPPGGVANWISSPSSSATTANGAGILRRREAEDVRVACGDDGVIDVDGHAA
jgi:hypothetical protein